MTFGSLPSMTATTELVVPRSIPMILPIGVPFVPDGSFFCEQIRAVNCQPPYGAKSKHLGRGVKRNPGWRAGLARAYTERMFHPVVDTWFVRRFGEPTPAQTQAWPLIADGRDVLVTAPTGSGKTLAAFLSCLDRLIAEAIEK